MRGRTWTSVLAAGILGIVAAGAGGSAGCSATKPTELVPGAITQVNIPKSLGGIRIQVYANGNKGFDGSYQVTNGVAFLPATLGVVAGGSASTKVEILIAGFDDSGINPPPDAMGNAVPSQFGDPTVQLGQVGSKGGPRVKRGSVQTYVDQHTLFLPMNLSYSCWGQDCEGDAGSTAAGTCKAASCVTNVTDPHTLVDFDPSLVDGTQDCFSPANCFTPVVTAEPVDASKCIYTVPPGETTGPGLNVRVIYQDLINPDAGVPYNDATSEQEILNVEAYEPNNGLPLEGFAVPDSNKPYTFQLGSGLCSLVKNFDVPPPGSAGSGKHYHAISAVQVSTTCPSKPPLLPVCASEQNQPTQSADGGPSTDVICNQPITLVQAPSAIYLVMDDSSIMAGAYGKDGYATTMGLALGNPVFKRTYVAFEFMDHRLNDCTASAATLYAMPGSGVPNSLDFTLANIAQPNIAQLLLAPPFPDPVPDGGQPVGGFQPLALEAALRLDVGSFKHLSDFSSALTAHKDQLEVGAVMFFINRVPTTSAQPITYLDGGLTTVPPSQYAPPSGQDCFQGVNDGGPAAGTLAEEIAAADQAGLQSYFVVLANGLYQIGDPLSYFNALKATVSAPPYNVKTMQVLDATEPKSQIAQILGRFSSTATALGTCLYELPPGIDQNAKLQFTVPVPVGPFPGFAGLPTAPTPLPLQYDATCNASTQDTANGWNIDANHIRVCGASVGNACWQIRAFVQAVSAQTLLSGAADGGTGGGGSPVVPEVPVTATMPCVDGGAGP